MSNRTLTDSITDYTRRLRIKAQFNPSNPWHPSHNSESTIQTDNTPSQLYVPNNTFIPVKSNALLEEYYKTVQTKSVRLCNKKHRYHDISNNSSIADNHDSEPNRTIMNTVTQIHEQPHLKVCLADKNLGFTIVKKEWYDAKALNILQNLKLFNYF
jgi:hypothetical protein